MSADFDPEARNVHQAPREPQIMPPRATVIGVKRALRKPIHAMVRWPVGKSDWRYTVERIA